MSTARTQRGDASPARERNLGRRRALKAWEWASASEGLGNNYVTLAKKLPSLLQVSGLGQTLAYLYGKGYERGKPKAGSAEGRLLEQLAGHLQETQKRAPADPMETLLSLTRTEYREASREIAAVADWLKRFAEGKIA